MKLLYTLFFIFTLTALNLHTSAQIAINEYSCSNLTDYLDNYEKSEDWVELYNNSPNSISLGGYYLSDKSDFPTKWEIPDEININAYGFVTFWCSGRDELLGANYHTNFRLKQTADNPESIVLADPDGNVVEEHELYITKLGHSMGRETDGMGSMKVCIYPTKGSTNAGSEFYSAYASKPDMDVEAGFFSENFKLTITTIDTNATIHYTTNGYRPTASSPVYSDSILVDETQIVKAIAIQDNDTILPSFIEFNTYFLNVTHQLAVLSTSSDDLETLLNGDEYMRPHGTIEYFNVENERTSFGYGEYNKHGQDSWAFPHRSFDYIARDEMGYSDAIHEKLLPYTDRDDYQRIIIRASGDDNYPGIDSSAHMRDMFIQTVAAKNNLNVDLRRAERCVVYVNGGFWGVYSIREKPTDHDYTNYYYDQDKFNIYYLMNWGYTWAEYGGQAAFDDWNALHDYAMNHDLSNPEYYQYVADRLDVTSLVDYVLVNSYVVCTDWVTWNTAWWRGLNPDGGHKKWGYILWDEDATFNHYINYTNVPDETANASPCFPEGIQWSYDPEKHIILLNKLKESPEFYQYYVSRYADLHNTAFKKEDLHELIDTIKNQISYDMHMQVARWGGSHSQWEQNVKKVKTFIRDRDEVFSTGLLDCYDLLGPFDITLNVEPEGIGEIKINSITPDEFQWEGSYFGGIDTKLKATATTVNYEFDYWELENHTVSPGIFTADVMVSLTEGDNITAHFKEVLFSDSLIINEINYHSADNFDVGDYVEFYNPMPYDLDISDWYFKDSNEENSFVFPEGTVIETDGYLVLVRDSTRFEILFPEIYNFIGEMSFKLSAGGELIQLFNPEGTRVDWVEYDDQDPWPTEPDGNGPTLELINPALDNTLAQSWQASFTEHGTPGEMNSVSVGFDDEPIIETITLNAFPNPFSTRTVIEIYSNSEIRNGEIVIYDLFGKAVQRIDQINTRRVEIDRATLSKGMYICRFNDRENRMSGVVKLVVL